MDLDEKQLGGELAIAEVLLTTPILSRWRMGWGVDPWEFRFYVGTHGPRIDRWRWNRRRLNFWQFAEGNDDTYRPRGFKVVLEPPVVGRTFPSG